VPIKNQQIPVTTTLDRLSSGNGHWVGFSSQSCSGRAEMVSTANGERRNERAVPQPILRRNLPGWLLQTSDERFSSTGPRRVHAMPGDTAMAKPAYQDSFTLWKDADTDVLT
jgi:hypothetical protein